MIDLLFIYCAFMYLFASGFAYAFKSSNTLDVHDKSVLAVVVIFAPTAVPIIFGIVYCNENF